MGLELRRPRQPRRLPLSTCRVQRARASRQRRRALCMGSRSSSGSPRSRCASLLIRHRVEDLCCTRMLAAACKGPRQHAHCCSAKLCGAVSGPRRGSPPAAQALRASWRGTGAPGAGDVRAGCGGCARGAAAEREDPARDPQHHGVPDTLREGHISPGMGHTRTAYVASGCSLRMHVVRGAGCLCRWQRSCTHWPANHSALTIFEHP